jgi:filamentous hemagglutinin family protein
MKKVLAKIFSGGWRAPFWISLSFVAAGAAAVPLQEARVSQVIQDVRLLEAHAAPRPAAVNDKVIFGSAVRTGVQSRTELTFNDLTITRLGANTIFSFTAGAREAELTQGTILIQVPPKAAPVRANTTAITVSVTGGTALLATGPPTKFMVLEGIGTIYPRGHPEKAVTVHGGEMVIAENGHISNPEKFDVKLVLETSPLILDFPPLANLPLILAVVDQQRAEQLVVTSNPPPYRSFLDVIDVTDLNANANPVVVEERIGTPSPTVSPPPPPPTPSKFGTPSTIASPNPYVITSGTTITTDPAITTNGVTDYGKIYRGPTDDGAFSVWAFGSTSAVDTALDFDTHFNNAGHFPGAVFKFTSLELAGNPTIDLSNGGVTNLALISVGDITSGLPGGTLTFSGLDALLLASQDGSINLGSEITFQDIPTLFFYARGTNGDLTLMSPIIGTTDLFLYAGRNITFNAGTDLTLGGQFSARSVGGNISVSGAGDIGTGGSLAASVNNNGGDIGTGGNISLTIGGDLTAGGDAAFTVQNTAGTITNGGNITVMTNGSISTGGELNLLVENYDFSTNPAGHIGTGGNISLTTGGNLTADSVGVVINNGNGGQIGSAVNLTLNVGGALTTLHEAPGGDPSLGLVIFNRVDLAGSMIAGDATLSLHADSASIGGTFFPLIHNRGSTIGGDALMNINITHDLMVQGLANIWLINATGGRTDGSATVQIETANISTGADFSLLLDNSDGGTIGSDATINVNANNISTGGAFDAEIDNFNGGSIGGAASVALNVGNNVTAPNGILLQILNGSSGHIVTGANVLYSVGGTTSTTNLTEYIDNSNGGVIDNGGNVTLHTVGPVMLDGGLDLEVDNFNGGTINNGANLTAHFVGDVTATAGQFHSLNWNVLNGSGFFFPTATGGTIGTGGNINVTFDGNASTTGTLDTGSFSAQIQNGSGGSIGTGGNISVTVGGNLTAGPLFLITENQGGHIGTGGNNTLNVSGDITTQGDAQFGIFNQDNGNGPGTIDLDATINMTAANISSGGSLFADIYNFSGGTIGGSADLNFNLTGDLTTQGDAEFFIDNDGGGTIGGNAAINVSAANVTANSLVAQIDNSNGGTIGGDATINMNVSGNASVTNDASVAIYGSDGAASAAININGGSYNAGGQFLTYIDGDGTITFNNASAHADVLKAGVFGANGVLNIGGGILSADTTLKLYANGSNGTLNFLSNVTLGGSAVKILAANTINILDGIVVTIGGGTPAEVFTTNANYTGFGGNGTTTGTFAGAGANNPLPLNQAPPFGAPPSSPSRRGNITTINVSNTADLLALLDGAVVGPDGRITISDSRNITNLRNLSRINMNGLPRGARRMFIHEMRERSTMRAGGRRIL